MRAEQPDSPYLKGVFHALRSELEVELPKVEHRLPEVPTEFEAFFVFATSLDLILKEVSYDAWLLINHKISATYHHLRGHVNATFEKPR